MCPSPYGEVGFNRAKTLREAKIEAASFRPLTGKLVLIPVRHGKESREIRLKFPSPYGEVGFNLSKSGHYVVEDAGKVSVPLRGSWF